MRYFVRVVLAMASLLFLLPVAAAAQTQITIGPGTGGSVEFTNEGTGTAAMSFLGSCGAGAHCIQGDAYIGTSAGRYDMWITGNNPLLTTTASPDVFAVNMNGGTLNFNFSVGSSTFTGTIQLTILKDGTSAPEVLGTLTVSSATGVFAALWKAGNIVPLDMTFSLPPGNPFVGTVVNGGAGSTNGTVSSGEIIAAPEPTSIALIGSGLLAIGTMLKRRLRT